MAAVVAQKPTCSYRVDLGEITSHNIKQLKRLNQHIFPITYNDKFYKDVLEVGNLAKFAFFNDVVVGAVCCRVHNSDGVQRLYIMTLGCLEPYRNLGVGRKLLEHVLDICTKGKYKSVFLHVQVNNETAISFYQRFGFVIKETKEQYYKKIEPTDAYVLEKSFGEEGAPAVKENGV